MSAAQIVSAAPSDEQRRDPADTMRRALAGWTEWLPGDSTSYRVRVVPAAPSHGTHPPAPGTTTTRPAAPGRSYPACAAGGITSPEALLGALDTIRRAPEGHRRATLYGSARGVARMVGAGALTGDRAWDELRAAGQAAGQTGRETRAAILGAFRDEGVPLAPLADARGGA